jgi:hypothetical protein
MMLRVRFRCAVAALVAAVALAPVVPRPAAQVASTLPSRLSDRDFWRIVETFSEPGGYFPSDNLVSNERLFQRVVPTLLKLKRGGAYLGVAPDQNFTYIVALEPDIAFIIDIRRANLVVHLMYKAIIELSADRAEFVSRLFSRRRPAGLDGDSSAADILEAFRGVEPSEGLFLENTRAIEGRLTSHHGFVLTDEDLSTLERAYGMFRSYGPDITYASSSGRGGRNMPSYAELQTSTDLEGLNRAYLGSEQTFGALKAMQEKNLIVPIVGDFAGQKALRAVARYLADHGATVRAFYTSNVEQYLFQNGVWREFYSNVAALPIDETSTFIRSARGADLVDSIPLLLKDVHEGRIVTYGHVTSRGSIR